MSCQFPKCENIGIDWHHIAYEPIKITRKLCHRHHVEITKINTAKARQKMRKLSSDERIQIYNDWLEGKFDVFNAECWMD